MEKTMTIDLPVRGTWITPNTPGKKIPSHGTDKYGETYAFDFVGVDANSRSNKFYNSTVLSYLINGIPLNKCYGWGSEIFAPFDGEIVKIESGVIERNPVSLKNDIGYMRRITKLFESGEAEYREVAGNHIIMKKSEKIFALFAHLKENSICVKKGEIVKAGQLIGRVGHSGNSTAPHLHFQLMDNIDPKKSSGIPCSFRNYEEYRNGKWEQIEIGVPSKFRIKKI
jgi:murein DD-endopeptidase MepM/ murein hydrolase activator NlpD